MSDTIRLKIKSATITPEGILIDQMEIIDRVSGTPIKIAKLTPELLEFLKSVEISLDDYLKFSELKKKNPELIKLINTFQLYT